MPTYEEGLIARAYLQIIDSLAYKQHMGIRQAATVWQASCVLIHANNASQPMQAAAAVFASMLLLTC